MFSKGDLYELRWSPRHSGSAEVPIGEEHGSHKGPGVEDEAHPTGDDFDPHSRPLAGHILEIGIGAVPAGQGHHDVQGSQAEH